MEHTTLKSAAVKEIARLVDLYLGPIIGRKPCNYGTTEGQIGVGAAYFEFDRGWAITVTASVLLRAQYEPQTMEKFGYEFQFEMTWPSTGRDLTEAQAAIDLYSEVIAALRAISVGVKELGEIIPDPKKDKVEA